MVAILTTLSASAESRTLQIYGNANLDNTIDEKDVAYVEGVIKGANAATNLSDANYDGKIDEGDITQIEQIMDGVEKNITIIDSADRVVTVKTPVNRIVALVDVGVFEVCKAQDKVVGVYDQILTDKIFPGWSKVPDVGKISEPDAEKIISLNPDLLVTWPSNVKILDETLPDNITVIGLVLYDSRTLIQEMRELVPFQLDFS